MTHPPPPPLKRAPPRDRDQPGTDAKKLKSEKLVKSEPIKVAIEPPTAPNVKKSEKKTERKELESKKSDVNTADIRYLIGVPLLFAAITVLPQLVLIPQGKAPRISLIVISIVPVITFIFIHDSYSVFPFVAEFCMCEYKPKNIII